MLLASCGSRPACACGRASAAPGHGQMPNPGAACAYVHVQQSAARGNVLPRSRFVAAASVTPSPAAAAPDGTPVAAVAADADAAAANLDPTASAPLSPDTPSPDRAAGSRARRGRRAASGRGGAASPAAASAAAAAEADALFLDGGPEPLAAPRVGPVQVALLEGGRGRGLVATRGVQAGELLLACRPLAIAWADGNSNASSSSSSSGAAPAGGDGDTTRGAAAAVGDGDDARFADLQRHLLGRRFTGREAAWLSALCSLPPAEDPDGGGGGGGGGEALLPPPPELLPASGVGAEGEQVEPLPARLQDAGALADVVQANCLEPDGGGEDEHAYWARHAAVTAAATAETAAAAASPAAGPRLGPLGVWPEAAMLNHSCIPNTVAYVVGDTLFVRATRKVGARGELTVSYLPAGGGAYGTVGDGGDGGAAGAALLSPVEERRGALEGGWGFTCACARCTAEEALDPKLRALLAEITDNAAALRDDLEAAMGMLDEAAYEEEEEEEEKEEEEDEQEEGKQGAGAAGAGVRPGTRAGDAQALVEGEGGARAAVRRGEAAAARGGRGAKEADEEGEAEEAGEDDEEGDGRAGVMVGSVASQAGMLVELVDGAMAKLRLTPAQQMTAQSAVVPLYTLLWAALAARGEIEPRLAELVCALVAEVAPGSADHLWWAAAARDTAEMIAAEEEQLAAAATTVRSTAGGGGFGGYRRQDERVTHADKACYRAFTTRYGPISRSVYGSLLAARREREEAAAGGEDREAGEEQ